MLLNWFASFLQHRQQRVKLGACKSKWRGIKAEVPQGTKLGPIFCLVMVNDLTAELPMYKYVDDCTVCEVVITKEMVPSIIQQEILLYCSFTRPCGRVCVPGMAFFLSSVPK